MRPLILTAAWLTPAVALPAAYQDALEPAGRQAAHIYDLGLVMLVTCGVVFAAIMVALAIALLRTPRSTEKTAPDVAAIRSEERRPTLVVGACLVLSAIGLVGLIVASVATDRALAGMPLKDGVVIKMTGHQWWWEVMYDDHEPSRIFYTANELHIPVGRPVVIQLEAGDVIHSFWVPNLHGKKDLIPGRTNVIQIRADKEGYYRGQCAEFCGYQHAKMAFDVIAESPEKYEAWAAAQRAPAPDPQGDLQKRGQEVFLNGTCIMCHTIQGTHAQGKMAPDLTHLAGRLTLGAGAVPNTRGNLAGWVLDPHGIKPGVNMPPNALPAADLHALLAYLESLK